MSNSDLSSTIAQGLQQEAITLAEHLAARTDEPGLRRAAELLAILATVPTVDLRPHLEWALKRISTSLGEGEHFAAALHALEGAQQPAAVAPIAGHADIFQAGYWLSHQQLRPAGSFDINPLCDELKSDGWSEAPVFVGMPTLQVTLARCNEGDLAALVKRLARALRKAKPGNEMSDQAMDYLKRQGLLGSPLRDAHTLEAPAAPVDAMPWVGSRQPQESVFTWCRRNSDAVHWLMDNHASIRAMLAAASQAPAAPAAVLAEIVGCIDAANAEGLDDALVNNTDARLTDLMQRCLMPAFYAAIAAQAHGNPAHTDAAAPAAPVAVTIPDGAYCALQYVERALAAIANREEQVADTIERLDTIGKASKRAKAALTRLQSVAHLFDAMEAPAAPGVDASDTDLLDAMTQHRIGLLPEYGGSWGAEIYLEGACAQHIGNGATPRETLHAALAAMATPGGVA